MSFLTRSISLGRALSRNLRSLRHYSGSLYEPEYLEVIFFVINIQQYLIEMCFKGMKSPVPLYDTLNIQLSGYDFPILESYQKYLHNIIKNMDINVEDSWANPAVELQISSYKPQSEIVNAQFKLQQYQRTVQITDISTVQVSVIYSTQPRFLKMLINGNKFI